MEPHSDKRAVVGESSAHAIDVRGPDRFARTVTFEALAAPDEDERPRDRDVDSASDEAIAGPWQAALRASEQRFRLLYSGLPFSCLAVSVGGDISSVNVYATESLGYAEADMLGQSILSIVAPEYQGHLHHQLAHCRVDPTITLSGELQCIRADGVRRWARYRLRPIPGTDATSATVLVALLDVTQTKRANQQLVDYRARLQAMSSELNLAEERERRRIAIGLHDDVGQLLAVAQMKLASARESSAIEARALVAQAIEAVRSLTFELGSSVLHELGLLPAIHELVDGLRQAHGARGRVVTDERAKLLSPDARIVVFQAIRELIFNVIKHAAAATVTVSVTRQGRDLAVEVRDDGRGFLVEDIDDPSRNVSGFGLRSLRERLRAIGGSFTIASVPAGGTRARLAVPLDL